MRHEVPVGLIRGRNIKAALAGLREMRVPRGIVFPAGTFCGALGLAFPPAEEVAVGFIGAWRRMLRRRVGLCRMPGIPDVGK